MTNAELELLVKFVELLGTKQEPKTNYPSDVQNSLR